MQSGKCGTNLTWTLDGNGTLTISGKGEMEDYGWIFGKAPWRKNWKLVKKIIIEYGVTSIGEEAFRNCEKLTEIKIFEGVKKIGNWAFNGCENLNSIVIPDSVTSIGIWAFNACSSMTSIRISDGVTSIGNSTFRNCSSMTSIRIPDGVTSIGDDAFWCCKNLKAITIPDGVMTIGEKVFDSCDSLKEIYYPAGRGFEDKLRQGNNAQLIPYTTKPQFVTKPTQTPVKPTPQPVSKAITQSVVEKLRWEVEGKTLTVGGVREIESYSYSATPWNENLRDIQKIIIEDGVEKISARAFEDCTRLELLIIPASVKTIGDFAFTYCYCGDRKINNGKNVIWSLEDGTLMIKKNPAAKSDADFSTGFETWEVAEKNITGVKIERGIVPNKRFFDWLARMGNSVNVSF